MSIHSLPVPEWQQLALINEKLRGRNLVARPVPRQYRYFASGPYMLCTSESQCFEPGYTIHTLHKLADLTHKSSTRESSGAAVPRAPVRRYTAAAPAVFKARSQPLGKR